MQRCQNSDKTSAPRPIGKSAEDCPADCTNEVPELREVKLTAAATEESVSYAGAIFLPWLVGAQR